MQGRQAFGVRLCGARVLAVDDHADSLALTALVLESAGAEVRTAGEAESALAIIDEWLPEIVVANIAMPTRDGFYFIREVRARDPERGGAVPVIALTGCVRPTDRARIRAAGFSEQLDKPIAPPELCAAVARFAPDPHAQPLATGGSHAPVRTCTCSADGAFA